MRTGLGINKIKVGRLAAWLIPAVLFWVLLAFKIPYSFTQYFNYFVPLVFLVVLLTHYWSFRRTGDMGVLIGFGLTMLLFALPLSFLWSSGYSDNFLIGGLLPYKDAKNYYQGASQLLNGLPIRLAVNAVRRPLFSGFLSSLLLLTGQNLKISLALIAQLAGLALYLSARPVRNALGALAGAIFLTFMYFYFQLFIGYTMSESLGFLSGCLAFALLWQAAEKQNWPDFLLGLGLLLLAVSARAGAFLIFPLLALWAGWSFRRGTRFSIPVTAMVLVGLAAGYFVLNTAYPRLLGVPEGSSFENFAYTVYGQVRGGTGWHSAIDELGTTNPEQIYQAAWNVFLANPSGLLQGVLKAYSYFFLPGLQSAFVFSENPVDVALWVLTILILLRGLYLLVFKRRSTLSTLLLAGFVGILLSIPFLPPIDGGNRFYASTMPFLFVLLAVGTSRPILDETPATAKSETFLLRFFTVFLLALTVLFPPVVLRASSRPVLDAPACTPEQRPFVIKVNPGSYVDLVDSEPASCGLAPSVCLNDFRRNNIETGLDDFYHRLDILAISSQSGLRIIPTINLLDGYFQYFVIPDGHRLVGSPQELLAGCASRIQTESQRIFLVESVSIPGE